MTVLVAHREPDLRPQGRSREAEAAKMPSPRRGPSARRLHAVHSVREQRVATVTSLADSRFDWERVMRELALVLPDDVWLTNLTGKANPAVHVDGEGRRAAGLVRGPPSSWSAAPAARRRWPASSRRCEDIDGVTRVGVQSSQLGTQQSTAGTATTSAAHQRQLPDPRLHRPVPDRRRLRRRPRPVAATGSAVTPPHWPLRPAPRPRPPRHGARPPGPPRPRPRRAEMGSANRSSS